MEEAQFKAAAAAVIRLNVMFGRALNDNTRTEQNQVTFNLSSAELFDFIEAAHTMFLGMEELVGRARSGAENFYDRMDGPYVHDEYLEALNKTLGRER